ncbi:MAG: 23S rRNA (adenine(2503)-C(2))-methyltransferase RlmN [Myxococcota bacterium]|nr:23S rRNA (adenine(2503)-C(2))-methyltransferase RlmN [Myxococcota bacterium]
MTSGLLQTSRGVPGPLARSADDWEAAIRPLGGRPFHAHQLFRWIHARGVLDPAKMTDLPGTLRAGLEALGMERTVVIVQEHRAIDQTRKLLVRLADGASVETVLIPCATATANSALPSPALRLPGPADEALLEDADAAAAADDGDEEPEDPRVCGTQTTDVGPVVRVTQCVSTQVGCAMGCTFCASGVAGFKRHLGADEIVAQVLAGRARLEGQERLRNVVFMGMGEPLHNYEATACALRLLTHREGLALSARRVTVSTSGLVPEIARLGADFNGNIGLAVSLHGADDETRSRLMPINKKYPLAALMTALRAYPLPRRRRITIEYTLVAGQNDSVDEARKLARLLRGLPVKINLIPMNPITTSALGPPPMAGVLRFQQLLCDSGYSCFIRRRRGNDVAAACGQLALLGAKPKIRNRLLASR